MTRLLVSVRNAQEAQDALAAGAHLIDVKEPLRGALGPADAETWRQVHVVIEDACPASVALGELLPDAAPLDTAALQGFQFAKVGLAGCSRMPDWPERWSALLERLPAETGAVAVAYADHGVALAPAPQDVLQVGVELGCCALLIDTFDKTRGPLFAHLPPREVQRLIEHARDHQLIVVLGGSLSEQSVRSCVALQPDYLAVRGAVCRGGRQAVLDPQLVRDWVEQLAHASADQPRDYGHGFA